MRTANATPRDTSVVALISQSLAEIYGALEEGGDSPQARALRVTTNRYERIVRGWATVQPSNAQWDAMFDVVVDLHKEVSEFCARRKEQQGKRH